MEFIPTILSNKLSTKDKKRLNNSTHSVGRAVDFIHADFAKAEQAVFAFYKALSPYHIVNGHFCVPPRSLVVSWQTSDTAANLLICEYLKSSTVHNIQQSFMTKGEIEIQKALGTLSYKEYMKLKGIWFKADWWYFPIPKTMKVRLSRTLSINNTEHYPVADAYINDLYHSLSHNKYTEEEFADEIITQCYSCMSLETIDH